MMKKRLIALFLSLAMMFVAAGCSTSGSAPKDPNELKIACLAPSFLQILTDLGYADSIVAVDTNTQTILNFGKDLPGVDMMNPSVETLATLDLDIIFATDMTMGGTVEDPFKPLSDSGVDVEYFPTSNSIESIKSDIMKVAEILNTPSKGQAIVDKLDKSIKEVRDAAPTEKKTVYFEISPADAIYTFGNGVFLNELIEIAGGTNIFADKESWMSVSAEQIIAANPQVIFTNVNYTGIDEVASIKARSGWSNITAVKNGNVYYIDNVSTSQPNQNIVKALKAMADAIKSAK